MHRLRARRVGGHPRCGRVQRDHSRAQVGQRLREGRGPRQTAYVAHRVRLWRLRVAAAEGGAHQGRAWRERGRGRFVPADHRVHHLHDRDVGEVRHHGGDQLLSGHRRIQDSAHAPPDVLQHPGAGAYPLAFGDVDSGDRQPEHLLVAALQASGSRLEAALLGRVALDAGMDEALPQGLPGLQHMAQRGLRVVALDHVVHVADRPSDQAVRGHSLNGGRRGVQPHHSQVGVQQVESDR